MIRFVNAIADEVARRYPDKVVGRLPTSTRASRRGIRVRPNVMPCLCSIECEFKNPLGKSPYAANRSFIEDLKGWAAQTDQLYIWDYTTNFADYLYPFPNIHALQENIRTFRAHKVKSLFEQGAYQGRHADFAELKTYLISKWMWNPDLPIEPLLQTFFDGYYGAASKIVRRYFEELHALPRDPVKEPLLIYESPYSPRLPDAFLEHAETLWNEAEALVADDPVCSYNVRMGRLAVDTTRLLRHRDPAMRWDEWQALARKTLAAFGEAGRSAFPRRANTIPRYWTTGEGSRNSYAEASSDLSLTTRVPIVPLDRLLHARPLYTLQVHVKGGGFKAVWTSGTRYTTAASAISRPSSSPMNSRGTTLTWHTAPGEYFWFNPTSPATEFDAIRLVKTP